MGNCCLQETAAKHDDFINERATDPLLHKSPRRSRESSRQSSTSTRDHRKSARARRRRSDGDPGRAEHLSGTMPLASSPVECFTVEQMTQCLAAPTTSRIDEGTFGVVYRCAHPVLKTGTFALKVLKRQAIVSAAEASACDEAVGQPAARGQAHAQVQAHGQGQGQGQGHLRKRAGHDGHVLLPVKYTPERTFAREAEVLGRHRHRNIVALVGHCIGPHVARPCLVYEFMAGQSLKRRLAPPRQGRVVSPPLLWKERLGVALDVARGLEFLHTLTGSGESPIVHQDVKTANVLLGYEAASSDAHDGALVAKLADFGTVRVTPELLHESHASTLHMVGTRPYMAPECTQSGHVSDKVDAYAFGVVLLELLTGRPPQDKRTGQALVRAVEAEGRLGTSETSRRRLLSGLDPRIDWGVPEAGSEPAPSTQPRPGQEAGQGRALGDSAALNQAAAVGAIARRMLEPRPRKRAGVRDIRPQLELLVRQASASTSTPASTEGAGAGALPS